MDGTGFKAPRVVDDDWMGTASKELFKPTRGLKKKEEAATPEIAPADLTEIHRRNEGRVITIQAGIRRCLGQNFLEKRKKMAHTRVQVMNEWVESERRFMNNLTAVTSVFISNFRLHADSSPTPIITRNEVTQMFGNWEQLSEFSCQLLKFLENKQMTTEWDHWTCLGDDSIEETLHLAMAEAHAQNEDEPAHTDPTPSMDVLEPLRRELHPPSIAQPDEVEPSQTDQDPDPVSPEQRERLATSVPAQTKSIDGEAWVVFNEKDRVRRASAPSGPAPPSDAAEAEMRLQEQVQLRRRSSAIRRASGQFSLPQGFKNMFPFLRLYIQYCGNYGNAIQLINRLCSNRPGFKDFLSDLESKPAAQQQSIFSYLIMPVQRIPRYNLLMRELLKETWEDHPDRPALLEAQEMVATIADQVNQAIRQAEDLPRVIEIHRQLKGTFSVVKPNRRYLTDAVVNSVLGPGSVMSLRLFLFNDLMVAASASDSVVRWAISLNTDPEYIVSHGGAAAGLPGVLHLIKHTRRSPDLARPFAKCVVFPSAADAMRFASTVADATRGDQDKDSNSLSPEKDFPPTPEKKRERNPFEAPPASYASERRCTVAVVAAVPKKEKRFFGFSEKEVFHVQIRVTTGISEWDTWHKEEDFHELHSSLGHALPELSPSFPPLPPAAPYAEEAPDVVGHWTSLVHSFLLSLVTCPGIGAHRDLDQFFGGFFATRSAIK